jgi:large subunit ribosomal protein L6e
MVRSRNKFIARGVTLYSRGTTFHKSGRWAVKTRGPPKPKEGEKKQEKPQPKTKPFGKGTRTIIRSTAPRYYPTEPVRHPLYSRKSHHRPPRLRKSIRPGTVLILLSGRYRGHRVIFLKRLPSGLLLITGPFKINGVPLRRVNQAFVIATSTRIDISGVKIPNKINDDYFRKYKKVKTPQTKQEKTQEQQQQQQQPQQQQQEQQQQQQQQQQQEQQQQQQQQPQQQQTQTKRKQRLLSKKKGKEPLPEERKKDQKEVDSQILPLVKKVPLLKNYLSARFSLKKKQYPHEMRF